MDYQTIPYYGILEDDAGTLWVSTENGLARRLPIGSEQAFFPLGLTDGLQTASFLPKAYLNSSESEQLFFGSTQGILALQPSLLQLDTPRPKFALHALSTFNPYGEKAQMATDYFIGDTDKRVQFGHKDQTINLTISDLNWQDHKGIRYEYLLEGFNRQWMPLGEDMQVTYTSLPPDDYVFKVRERNAENIYSEVSDLLYFTVYPPWWKSIWAYIFYSLLVGVIVVAIYRFQFKRQLEKQEADNLRELDTFKNKFYTNISHEFRTPLTIILGMNDQMEKQPEKWLKEGAEMIRKHGTHLLSLINQILDLQKLDAVTLTVDMQQGNIISFFRSIAEQFEAFVHSKRQKLVFISTVDRLEMDYDADKTLQIISNLLSNAIKYTPEKGQVKLTISKESNNEGIQGESLLIKIEDTGAGIPAEKLPHIFDRFYRLDEHTSTEIGTGIGLSLTKELVNLLEGNIEVSSELGKGSCFKVYLPIRNEAEVKASPATTELRASIFGTGSPQGNAQESTQLQEESISQDNALPIALVVEDNADIAKYLQLCLEGKYQVAWAENGQKGIDKALEIVPDIIISDVMMPEKDGFEVCETLKQDIRTSHIPFILLTAKSDVESRIAGLKQGADDYLAKPFHEEELLVRMHNLLTIRHRLQERYQNVYDNPLPKAAPEQTSSGTDTLEPKIKAPSLEDAFILKVKEIVEANMGNADFDLEQLGRELNLSRSNFYRKMKALTGRTPAIFIRSLRLQKARELLVSSDSSIKEIAYDVGFSDPAYFTKSYSAEFGESPSESRLK